jgi:serine/threonine protein kinase
MTPSAFSCDADSALAEVVADLTTRLEAGARLDPAAVEAEFPDHASELRRLLPALQALAASHAAAGVPHTPAPMSKSDRGRRPRRRRPNDRRLGDFRLVRELGRGGMGIVYEAHQVSLNRRVALKVLPFAAALNPRQLQRFKTEAQAAAQLHHSHIVPVYAVGCETGVHYYAMQLIDGQTLADAIARIQAEQSPHARKPGRGLEDLLLPTSPSSEGRGGDDDSTVLQILKPDEPSPSAVRAASTAANYLPAATTARPPARAGCIRTATELAAQAADALDYAHQVGVVHRDVKPANLMVDGRGHLWVTDFGLVRYADEGGLTVTGELLGTLRYMSPEQATARRGVVDHRTDIYALGATLYELLTLAPVHTGRSRADLFAQIVGADPVPLRRLNPAVPVDLETVVLKALAKDPDRRYQTAEELAADLRRFLADQPVKARRPSRGERLWRWVRRHRRLAVGGAVMAVFAVGCLAVSLAGVARERDEAVRRRAQARAAVDAMYGDVAEKWLADQPHLEPLQRDFLRRALAFYEEFAQDACEDPDAQVAAARAALRVGDIHARLGEFEQAEPAYEAAVDRLSRLLAERQAFASARVEEAVALNHRGVFRRSRGGLAGALADFRAAAALADPLAAADSAAREALAGSRANAGLALHGLGRLAEAQAAYRAALQLRDEMAVVDPASPNRRHDLASCVNNFGLLLRDAGRAAEAEAAFTRAIIVWHDLAADYPGVPAYRAGCAAGLHNRGVARASDGRTADADQDFVAALRLRDRLRQDFPQVIGYRADAAATLHDRGASLAAAGRHVEAEHALRAVYDLRQGLVAARPDDAGYRGDLAATHHALGDLLAATGRWTAAGAAYRASLALREAPNCGPAGPARTFELAATRLALGRVAAAAGVTSDAESLFRSAMAALAGHADAGPAWALALAAAEVDLGCLLAATGRAVEAGPIARRAAGRAAAVADRQPTAPAPREVLAAAWALAGELAVGRPDEAAAAFENALAARRWLADRPGARPRDLSELAWFLTACPDEQFRDPAGAVAVARTAADRAPHDARPWTRLGASLCRAGEWRAGADALEHAERLKTGGDRTNWLFLAVAYRRLGDAGQARLWAERVAAVGPAASADAEWCRLRNEVAELLRD